MTNWIAARVERSANPGGVGVRWFPSPRASAARSTWATPSLKKNNAPARILTGRTAQPGDTTPSAILAQFRRRRRLRNLACAFELIEAIPSQFARRNQMARKYSPEASKEVEREMHEFKRGKLKSGRSGKTVKNPKQAVAIGLAKARREGKKVPPPPRKRSASETASRSQDRSRSRTGSHASSRTASRSQSRAKSTTSRTRTAAKRSRRAP